MHDVANVSVGLDWRGGVDGGCNSGRIFVNFRRHFIHRVSYSRTWHTGNLVRSYHVRGRVFGTRCAHTYKISWRRMMCLSSICFSTEFRLQLKSSDCHLHSSSSLLKQIKSSLLVRF